MKKLALLLIPALTIGACSPTVKVEAPDKPIVINMNVNITQEVRVRVDKDLDKSVFSEDSPLF
jgi:hypothetical protein